jgi:hypothetical protein
MKNIKITTCADCEVSYQERVLASGKIHTVIGFKQLLTKARDELYKIRLGDPNCPLFIVVDGVKAEEFTAADLLATAPKNKGLSGLDDNSKIEKFLK